MAFFLAGSFRSEWLWRSFRRRFPVCPWQHRFCRCRRAPELPRVGFHGAIESIHGLRRAGLLHQQPAECGMGRGQIRISLRGARYSFHGEIHAAFGFVHTAERKVNFGIVRIESGPLCTIAAPVPPSLAPSAQPRFAWARASLGLSLIFAIAEWPFQADPVPGRPHRDWCAPRQMRSSFTASRYSLIAISRCAARSWI